MNKKLFIGGLIITSILSVFGYVIIKKSKSVSIPETTVQKTSYKDATYILDGLPVKLSNGRAETQAAPGSASKIITTYFGNELVRDINGDGKDDVVFLLTQSTGGSGLFYYVVAAIATNEGYRGSHGILIGDRIAPQTTEKGKGNITVVNYAVRAPGQNFTVSPSVGKSIWLILDTTTMQFGEVARDFEGEADPARMSLEMKPWTWEKATYGDEEVLKPNKTKAFTITFSSTGTFSATTDCNNLMGNYVTDKEKISFKDIASTKKFCEGSQESNFTKLLTETTSYRFTSFGELILLLKLDSGTVIFK